MSHEYQKCPYCGYEKMEADWVDIGVGYEQCGPYFCGECGASEIGPEFFDWVEKEDLEKGKCIMKEGHPFSEEEIKTGFYKSDKKSPYANTVNGKLVNHVTAKKAYNIGILDEKKI